MRIGRGIASLLTLSTRAIRVPTTQMSAPAFIDDVNSKYEVLHKAFEEQFWGTKMALSDGKYNTAELTRTKGEMERTEVTMVKRKMRQTAQTPSAQPSSSRLFLAMVTTQTKSTSRALKPCAN